MTGKSEYGGRFVVRRDGVASAFLYVGAQDCHGNYQWVEDLTEAVIFGIRWASLLAQRFQNEFDGTVEALSFDRAGREFCQKVEEDCEEGF